MKKGIIHISGVAILAVLIMSDPCEPVAPLSRDSQSLPPAMPNEHHSRRVSLNASFKQDLQYINKDVVDIFSAQDGIDFRLIVAMIKQESRFHHDAVSERGAQGLMQIMPVTHSEIAEEIDIQDPFHPRENLRAGVYYVAKLSELFKDVEGEDKIRLTLAAYNAGPSRIYDAQELAAYLGEDPHSWSSIRNMLPLLSKRYYSLHHSVWGTNRPPNGYYGSANQTVRYVENIMNTYHAYCKPS